MENINCGCKDRYRIIRPAFIICGLISSFLISPLMTGIIVKVIDDSIEVMAVVLIIFGIALSILLMILFLLALRKFVVWVVKCNCKGEVY